MTDQEIRATALALKEAKTVTLSDLQSYLGKAADLLRGSIDQADFKAFIFPLMFFKRISDVYLEEFAIALKESGGDKSLLALQKIIDSKYPKDAFGTMCDQRLRMSGKHWFTHSERLKKPTQILCTESLEIRPGRISRKFLIQS